MAWRIGQSWGSKPNPVLVTIVEEGTGEPDASGRRLNDRLVGCASLDDALRITRAVNLVTDAAYCPYPVHDAYGLPDCAECGTGRYAS
jgi:hypothetical protein